MERANPMLANHPIKFEDIKAMNAGKIKQSHEAFQKTFGENE